MGKMKELSTKIDEAITKEKLDSFIKAQVRDILLFSMSNERLEEMREEVYWRVAGKIKDVIQEMYKESEK